MESNRDLLRKFLSGIETGSAMAAAVVDERRYIQHNPQTADDGPGIAALFERLSRTDPKVHFIRVFQDGDIAFAHNLYDFASMRVAFEVFRFENGRAVEHWDNIQPQEGPNPAGRSMIDGETEIRDLELTEANRALVRSFAEEVLVKGDLERLPDFVACDLVQHAPDGRDGVDYLRSILSSSENAQPERRYEAIHRVFAEGNFVLCQCEGYRRGVHSGIYDLYRVADGRIAEHWGTIEAIPPRDQWRNQNGKF